MAILPSGQRAVTSLSRLFAGLVSTKI
jgi:hypothetical protein